MLDFFEFSVGCVRTCGRRAGTTKVGELVGFLAGGEESSGNRDGRRWPVALSLTAVRENVSFIFIVTH